MTQPAVSRSAGARVLPWVLTIVMNIVLPVVTYSVLTGRGVHVITVNDYLAKRDVQWMGQIYHALGLTIGCIQHDAAFQYNPEFDSDDERMRFLEPIERKASCNRVL